MDPKRFVRRVTAQRVSMVDGGYSGGSGGSAILVWIEAWGGVF